ncbi:hypothetical protein [Lentzea guizhouensis]|nr:hypothetical protein [Lentzea guizhouensis]
MSAPIAGEELPVSAVGEAVAEASALLPRALATGAPAVASST